jgi:hypothetical protein
MAGVGSWSGEGGHGPVVMKRSTHVSCLQRDDDSATMTADRGQV